MGVKALRYCFHQPHKEKSSGSGRHKAKSSRVKSSQHMSTDDEVYPSDNDDEGINFKPSSSARSGKVGGRRRNRHGRNFAKSPMPLQVKTNSRTTFATECHYRQTSIPKLKEANKMCLATKKKTSSIFIVRGSFLSSLIIFFVHFLVDCFSSKILVWASPPLLATPPPSSCKFHTHPNSPSRRTYTYDSRALTTRRMWTVIWTRMPLTPTTP